MQSADRVDECADVGQWRLPQRGNTDVVIAATPLSRAGIYYVVVTNAYGTVTSSNATLTVTNLMFSTTGTNLKLTASGFRLRLSGMDGRSPVIIYASTDLKQWVPIYTNPPTLGPVEFIDSEATNFLRRFY